MFLFCIFIFLVFVDNRFYYGRAVIWAGAEHCSLIRIRIETVFKSFADIVTKRMPWLGVVEGGKTRGKIMPFDLANPLQDSGLRPNNLGVFAFSRPQGTSRELQCFSWRQREGQSGTRFHCVF